MRHGTHLWRGLSHGVGLLLVMTVLGATAAHAQDPSGEVVEYGREVAALLRDDDIGAVVDRFAEQLVVCPGDDAAFHPRTCEGAGTGDEVEGYLVGLSGGDAALLGGGGLGDALRALRGSFRGDFVQLYTASDSGRTSGFLACAECQAFVLSTAEDRDLGDGRAFVGYFQVMETDDGLRLHSFSSGVVFSDDVALVSGGSSAGQDFAAQEVAEPTPTPTEEPEPTETPEPTEEPTPEPEPTEAGEPTEVAEASPTSEAPIEDETDDSDDGSDWIVWLALGIAALGLIAGGAIGVYGWNRPRGGTNNTRGEYYDDDPYDDEAHDPYSDGPRR